MNDSCSHSRLVFRLHAIRRMFERSISEEDVRDIVENGKIIAKYEDDKPYPSRLMLGWRGIRPVHVVVASNQNENEDIIVTVYEPDAMMWDELFEKKRGT